MAKATITIEDMENGNTKVNVAFDPPLTRENTETPESLSDAQFLALQAVSAIHDDEELSSIPTTRTLQ